MATFYARYPASVPASSTVTTVQGEGTPGAQTGGVLTVQGDPAGTPVPVSGTVTATNPSVGTTGAAAPASATYVGALNGGNLIGVNADSSGRLIQVGAGVAGTPAGGVVSIQGVATGTVVPVSGTVTANQGGAPWSVTGSGAAGTAATGVVTVQGIASMTPLLVNGSGSTQPVSGTVTANQGGAPWAENVTQFGGSAVVTGTGTGGAGIPRVTVSSDSTVGLVAGSAIIGNVRIDQTTPGTTNGVQVTAALPAGSNIIGNFRVDQTTPGTTNGVVVNSIGSTTAVFQAEASVAFGAITASYVTLFTPSAATKILQLRNNMNASVSVSFDAGSTTNYVLDAGDAVSLDLLSNTLAMPTTAIQVKYTVGAPTSGSFRINGCH